MNTSQEAIQAKKWFVYVGDKHEGPFSVQELHGKIVSGQASLKSFVWCEGMPDWKPIADLSELSGQLQALGGASTSQQAQDRTKDLDPKDLKAAAQGNKGQAPSGKKFSIKISPITWVLVGILLLMAAAGALVAPMITSGSGLDLSQIVDAVPILARWISPIPTLEDVKKENYEALKEAAKKPLQEGPAVAIAVAEGDLTAPSFYVATNLPEGAEFDLYVEGVGKTLLNQMAYAARARVIVGKKLGKSRPIKQADGRGLVRGEYLVALVEADTSPAPVKELFAKRPAATYPSTAELPRMLPQGRKLLISKKLFLGGTRDATYLARLKEYHEKIIGKANLELTELKQYTSTLESQLKATNEKYESLKKGPKLTAPQLKQWNAFHEQWTKMHSQLVSGTSQWTGERLITDYFYGPLFGFLQETSIALEKVHGAQHLLFAQPLDAKKLPGAIAQRESEIAEPLRQGLDRLAKLKTVLDEFEKSPPSLENLPTKMEQAP